MENMIKVAGLLVGADEHNKSIRIMDEDDPYYGTEIVSLNNINDLINVLSKFRYYIFSSK